MLKAASLAIIEQLESQGAYNYDATKGVDGRGGYEPRRLGVWLHDHARMPGWQR